MWFREGLFLLPSPLHADWTAAVPCKWARGCRGTTRTARRGALASLAEVLWQVVAVWQFEVVAPCCGRELGPVQMGWRDTLTLGLLKSRDLRDWASQFT
ncbi:hypothetical protein SAMN04488518_102312 [Pseudovibrio ascidiaceicola]|uniref:Secreted protein n=1 Tax=Pseudovibrio ascidiaceicola TaxID=285279 RepID=A0A1I3X2F6_9HYPH|nr:hypothetical protein SAMN04488518_102312 [Pseudovibrio ascidiaceicola]